MDLKIEYLRVVTLKNYKNNARTHSDAQIEQIAHSINEFGFTNPLLIDENNGVIAGHGRLMACNSLDIKQVPCIRLNGLSKAQKRAYVIADNSLALNAGWNVEILKTELDELNNLDFDFDLLGLDLEDFDIDFEDEQEGLTNEDDVPEVDGQVITKKGDIWLLGEHRLMCGDSTKADDVGLLVDNNNIDMVFTDPPYGISHSGKGITGSVNGNDFGEIMGDSDVRIAVDVLNLCLDEFNDSTLIFFGANYYCQSIPNGYGWLVWDKEREGNTFSGAELAFVNKGVRLDVFRHMWHGMVKASEHGQKRVHPTQKPIALAEWCFKNYGEPKTVLDLFGGSGSTLIACKKTKRKCHMMEIDNHYCDVIINRWQAFTGKKAIHAKTSKEFKNNG